MAIKILGVLVENVEEVEIRRLKKKGIKIAVRKETSPGKYVVSLKRPDNLSGDQFLKEVSRSIILAEAA